MSDILNTLAAELERLRVVSPQVTKHIVGQHDVPRESIGAFLTGELPKLEDYEIDLALAPLFTPTLADQSIIATHLGDSPIPPEQWPMLVQQLVTRPILARLATEDGTVHRVQLREVTIERFVHRLRLDGTVRADAFQIIGGFSSTEDRSLATAIARRAIWANTGRSEILLRFLTNTKNTFHPDDAVALLKLVETYEPATLSELLASIPHWRQVLRQEINEGGAKPFFNERVEDLHGGGRDQRRQNNTKTSTKENEMAFLERLQLALA